MNSLNIAKRNILIFFRDKTSVFFSLLAVFIIIGLYVLFLGNVMTSSMTSVLGTNARFILDSWIMAGIISITSITTTMGAFEAMVNDKSNKILKDFNSSPIKKWELALGYILSSVVIGIIMCLAALVLAEIYIMAYGGHLLSLIAYIKIICVIIISVISSSAMVFLLVSFFKSSSAFATGSTIIGTLIGFLTGIYIPIGQLPSAVQTVIKIFPVSHSGALLRQIMMNDATSAAFANAPAGTLEQFNIDMGVNFQFGSYTSTPFLSVAILAVAAVVFYGLAIISIARKSK